MINISLNINCIIYEEISEYTVGETEVFDKIFLKD